MVQVLRQRLNSEREESARAVGKAPSLIPQCEHLWVVSGVSWSAPKALRLGLSVIKPEAEGFFETSADCRERCHSCANASPMS